MTNNSQLASGHSLWDKVWLPSTLVWGDVPLSALVPFLVNKNKGAAMAILNRGTDLPVFVGPALVGLFIGWVGNAGIIWILDVLYLINAFLTPFIIPPDNAKTAHDQRKWNCFRNGLNRIAEAQGNF